MACLLIIDERGHNGGLARTFSWGEAPSLGGRGDCKGGSKRGESPESLSCRLYNFLGVIAEQSDFFTPLASLPVALSLGLIPPRPLCQYGYFLS